MYSYTPYRIPVSETDLMGIVHHSNYNRYFERGRVEFLRQIGISYRDLSDNNIHFPVLRTECRYRRPLKFDDEVAIETRISFLSKTRLCFKYRILREENPKLRLVKKSVDGALDTATIGESEHCCLAPDGKPQRIPSEILKTLEKFYSPEPGDGHD